MYLIAEKKWRDFSILKYDIVHVKTILVRTFAVFLTTEVMIFSFGINTQN